MKNHVLRVPPSVPAKCRVIVVGGDGRVENLEDLVEGLRTYPSSYFGGAGGIRSALATIKAESTDLVVLLVRWLGHSDYYAIMGRCRTSGVRVLAVSGGLSAARREIYAALGRK